MNIKSLLLIALSAYTLSAQAQTVDRLVFGNATSEASHALADYFPPATDITSVPWINTPAPSQPSATAPSEVIAGGMGLSARRLLPRTPNGDVYGGQITFTMAVDPLKQNYLSAKMWGADPGKGYLILNVNGKEVGNRHSGGGLSEDPFYFSGGGWYPNRFFYRTEPLPLYLTRGRTSVTITIRSLGTMYFYAPIWTYVNQYQQIMAGPSPALYTAYTHTGSIPDVSGEVQGSAPAVLTPRALENETTSVNNTKTNVNNTFASKLNATGSTLTQGDAVFLASCYDAKANTGASWIVYPAGKTQTDLANQILAALDTLVTNYATDATVATGDWGGALGEMGDAIRLSWPLISGSLNTTVAYGGTLSTVTRQAGWAAALRASVDSGRLYRRTIANQEIAGGWAIYRANRGLLLVDASRALQEAEATRYFKEGCGILPFLGNDLASGGTDGLGGGPVPTRNPNPPNGPDWYMATSKGTTKDGNGFVGSDYGELGTWVYKMGLLSGDTTIVNRGLVMARARAAFRYPGVDAQGYLVMMGTDPIGVRNNDLPSHYAYLGRGYGDDLFMASQGAAAIGNDLLGYYQQAMNDGQLVRSTFSNDPYLPGRWATFRALSQTNVKLPTTSGEPDSAWADEENMVVAAKHGEERFYANLFWRQPDFINGLAKVFHLTPTSARLADVMVDDIRFRSTGGTFMTTYLVDSFLTPPDKPMAAYGGQPQAIAWRSDLASVPANNRDGGRGTGYTFRYGNWLVGMNADHAAPYAMQMPSNFTSATDLISGTVKSGQVVLAPKTSAVFYLPTNVDPNPAPSRSLVLGAAGGNGSNVLGWANAAGASSYNVLRATTSGGPYTTLASGLTAPRYRDTAVTNGTRYYYVITSVGDGGTSGYSAEAGATPAAPQTAALASPWSDLDLGTSTGGSASVGGSTCTVTSGPGDISGGGDNTHFLYQPVIGDFVVTARVDSSSSANNYAKAGLMVRDSLTANSPSVSINIEARRKIAEFLNRGTYGGNTAGALGGSGLVVPYWVRLTRIGSTITGSISPDGVTWTLVGSTVTSSVSYEAYVGLAAAPANTTAGQTNTAVFSNVVFPLGATAAPAAPTGLTASTGVGSASLAWNGVSGATSYLLSRGTSASGPFTPVAGGLAGTTAEDFGLVTGTYYYVVSAANASGSSANSAALAVTLGTVPAPVAGFTATASSGQVALAWSSSAGATSYTVTRSTGGGTAAVLASGLTGTTYTDTTAVDGTAYTYGVFAVNAAGPSTQGGSATVLPPGLAGTSLETQDVGAPLGGAASYANGVHTLLGSGSIQGRTVDDFRYSFQAMTGDGIVTARVLSLDATSTIPAAGVMIRESLAPGARYQYANVTPGFVARGQYRDTANANPGYQGTISGLTLPYWLRVQRAGNVFTAAASPDGVIWTTLGTRTIAMGSTVCVGLTTTANSLSVLARATFDNYSVVASTATGGTASASTAATGSEAAKAFDANTGTKWYNNQLGGTGWLRYQFASGVTRVVTRYQLTSANDLPQRDPRDWNFQGSQDGITWNTLDTRTNQVFAARYQANVYTVAGNTTAYANYRLEILANNGGSGAGLQLSEFAFLDPAATTGLPPSAPGSLSAVWSPGQVALAWPTAPRATSYTVKRALVPGGPYTTLAANLTATSYTDTGLANGTTYYYVVTAVNAAGESAPAPENSATPLAPPTTPTGLTVAPGDAQASLNWNSVAGAASYTVRRATSPGGPFVIVGTATESAYTDTGLLNGTTYYYQVSAVNLAAESAGSSTSSAVVAPVPAAPAIATQAGAAQAVVTWNAPAWATSYKVKRATASGGAYTTLASAVTTTSYTDTGLTDGTRYYYVVSAVNATGESADSRQVSATPGVIGAGFLSGDIGTMSVTGTASYSAGIYTVTGGGDIWNTADTLRYTHQPITGDATIVARVASQTAGKAGVMIRETLAANSRQVDVILHKNNGAKMELRSSLGGISSNPGRLSGVAAPYWVKLTRVGNVFTGFASADGNIWTQVAQSTVTMGANVYIGLMHGSGSTSTSATATFDNVSVVALPSPWQSSDIGTVAVRGHAIATGGGYTVTGSGADIYGAADAFRYAYQTASGDCDITLRVADVPPTHVGAKTGVMIRETLNADSIHAMVDITPGGSVEFIRRTATGGTSASTAAGNVAAPAWVRLVRSGDTFTASYSLNGTSWIPLGTATITMSSTVYLGLPVTSHADGTLNSAVLDNATINP